MSRRRAECASYRLSPASSLSWSAPSRRLYLWLLVATACCISGAFVGSGLWQQSGSSPFVPGRGSARRLGQHDEVSASAERRSVVEAVGATNGFKRRSATEDAFATIFHSELLNRFKFSEGSEGALQGELISTLNNMVDNGFNVVMFSCPWEWFEPKEGLVKYDYLDLVVESACNNTPLKVAFLLDVVRAPEWVYDKWPDAKAMDSHYRSYPLLSWFHADANRLALQRVHEIVRHLTQAFSGCVTAVQPVYNNEYEAKFTQENDCFQDFSPPALDAYRSWLQSKVVDLTDLNARWGTEFATWAEVAPDKLEAGSFAGLDLTPRYWDFLRFREVKGAEVLNGACAAVQQAGAQCFHHVPEFFSVLDALYGASLFKGIAASPHTDFLIMDSNFRTSFGTLMNPNKLRLFVSAAHSYGKPVYFEAAVERYADTAMMAAGAQNALLAGASGIGLTNWLDRVELEDAAVALVPARTLEGGSGLEAACQVDEVVGVFIHLDSCMAWRGLQWMSHRKDPLNDFVENLAGALTERCGTDIAVFLELDRLLAAMHSLDRIVFVEPLLLYNTQELQSYNLLKAALQSKPHEVLRMPSNNTHGVQLVVLEDLR